MRSNVLKINKYIYYGWIVLAVAAISVFFSSPGQTYSISVFNKVYENEFGFSKTELSSLYSIATTISGLLMVFVGKSVDRFGHRKMYVFVILAFALSIFLSSFVSSLALIFITFFLLRFFGQGSMTIIPTSLVPQWFEKRRAFALSLFALGSFAGTLFVPRLNLWMIETYTWQVAWRIWGIALIIILLPLVLLFIFNRPEDVGLSMENENNILSSADSLLLLEKTSFNLKQAIHTKSFWLLGIMSMIIPMFTTGVTFHFYALMGEKGVSETRAAWIIGLIAFPIIIMPIISKMFIDKVKPKYVFMLTQTMIFISMLMLLIWVQNEWTALIFILFYGFFAAIQSVTLNVVWPNYYGRKYLGSIRGMTTLFMVIGSALGPLPFGVSYDIYQSYNPAIIAMMIFGGITILFTFIISKPEKR